MDPLIIGLGHKARQGKDYVAELAAKDDENAIILHFADSLKKEVTNADRIFPLIYKDVGHYRLLDKINEKGDPEYIYKFMGDVPNLHKLFFKRHIKKYMGMDEKDAPMLQFWGTDFRRATDDDYWIKRLEDEIAKLDSKYRKIYIPDVRFRNEHKFIKDNNGIYVDIIRLNPDKTRWLDPSRDPNHPSETDLDNVTADISVEIFSEDFASLAEFAEILKKLQKKGT